jgi:hypothetical protein
MRVYGDLDESEERGDEGGKRGVSADWTLDNCNTENTERLHIDLAKDAYQSTNRKNEFSQMTLWLERKEKIHS